MEPLACSMAIELYFLAAYWFIEELMKDTIKYLFIHYKKQRIIPSIGRLNRIFKMESDASYFPLQRFCVDIYYKLCKNISVPFLATPTDSEVEQYPVMFLYHFFALHCSRGKERQPDIQEPFVMKLCDYRFFRLKSCKKDCLCQRKETNDDYYIK